MKTLAGDVVRLQSFNVAYKFPVIFTRDVFAPGNLHLRDVLAQQEAQRCHRLAVFVDSGVLASDTRLLERIRDYALQHAPSINIVGDIVVVPGGEVIKNDGALLPRIIHDLMQRSIDRHSFALAIGGGAVLDAVGYACAVFHRGVRHIRMPTTVLSQNDSGVGVKNAVNFNGIKNLTGTFAPPWAVINDFAFLDRLPDREKRAGLVEAVKVALIRDAAFYNWIEAHKFELARFDAEPLEALIIRSAELHMRQIGMGGDPFETGSARPLDFGHWAAHRLERLTGHRLNHGEAVAIGVALDTRYSVLAGFLPSGEDEKVAGLLETLGFSLWDNALYDRNSLGKLTILSGLDEFREHLGGDLTITLLRSLGVGIDVHEMDKNLIEQALAWLAARQ